MDFSVQPTLENENVKLIPLDQNDFEDVFAVASDPLVWEQHPNKDRYKREVFENFFKGALESGGAFKIIKKDSGEVAGSTRFYDYNPDDNSIFIGYTFYGTKFWGSKLNPQVKKLMLDYIFQFVDKVNFHVGKDNIRSQKAMEKLGAKKVDEVNVSYAYEPERLNVVFEILKADYLSKI
ncbi:GNAT family N-acetyltransferase [Epilithonimonas ginsengisoli]|uniref:GNAT family N-acetyltransferase n=1 Tax=Epilithonimonas ginsengisoli TaxID=1245592 RepID=A0ABU4JKW5_9FLAO|nr:MULTISPECIES: GNAT family N-acetyltransferase [Chryseobacterium group]MBV6881381.1 GNAT family N-acetyltransferase [Epilithonimonas sp. FP105]MDW8550349.1 GNAT family N-acetyltransferase [Epilithonimonas ginsengisoli]OAH68321.1 acetyltransferase [Chryseobacterium sp. FP211-J200]